MTFRKPSTITSQTGSYSYKSGVSSTATNYIDNNFPNLLDKTGETAALGGGISGELEFLSGSSAVFDTGSIINMNGGTFSSNIVWISSLSTPTLLQNAPTSDVVPGNLNIQAADAYSGASTHKVGGNVVISTGNSKTISDGYSTLQLTVGHGAQSSNVLYTDSFGNTYLSSLGNSVPAIEMDVLNNNITLGNPRVQWLSTVASPRITQLSTSSGNGQNLLIQAQGTTSSTFGTKGGDLQLAAGTTSTTLPGNIIHLTTTDSDAIGLNVWKENGTAYAYLAGSGGFTLYPTPAIGGGFGGQSFSVGPWIGTVNTQQRAYSLANIVQHTAASGTNPYIYTVNVPYNGSSGAGGYTKVRWTAKTTTGGSGPIGGEAIMFFQSDTSGSITESASWINNGTPAGTYKDTNNYILYPTTTGSFTLQLIAQTAALDWSLVVEVVLN